jgi:hypothetical protein
MRLIEIELEDSDNPISNEYSNLYAFASKVVENNDVRK